MKAFTTNRAPITESPDAVVVQPDDVRWAVRPQPTLADLHQQMDRNADAILQAAEANCQNLTGRPRF
jgi:hypothetical protein